MPDAPITNDSPPETTGTTQPDAADSAEDAETTPTVVVENGRRRGKRRVMKKKKVKDEDGYLGKLDLILAGATHHTNFSNHSDQRRSCMGIILRRGT